MNSEPMLTWQLLAAGVSVSAISLQWPAAAKSTTCDFCVTAFPCAWCHPVCGYWPSVSVFTSPAEQTHVQFIAATTTTIGEGEEGGYKHITQPCLHWTAAPLDFIDCLRPVPSHSIASRSLHASAEDKHSADLKKVTLQKLEKLEDRSV